MVPKAGLTKTDTLIDAKPFAVPVTTARPVCVEGRRLSNPCTSFQASQAAGVFNKRPALLAFAGTN